MPRKLKDITNQKFGRLTVIEYAGMKPTGKSTQSAWLCKCECGKDIIVLNNNLKKDNTKSCWPSSAAGADAWTAGRCGSTKSTCSAQVQRRRAAPPAET